MRPLLTLVLVAATAALGCGQPAKLVPEADASTRRTTASGDVVGFRGEYGADVWRGIPFAAAPVGALRWRAPQPPAAWSGVREARAFGSPCTQYASTFGGVPGKEGQIVGSEDCLYLNVYTPRFADGRVPSGAARLPVMLWIHGGGNSIGEAGFYDGGHLAAAENVVVVTTNYRLGPFGWFRHAALRDGATAVEQSGNFATLDLIAALAWVRDNIAAFGGDPNNVTIFGESAGGQHVYSLLVAPPARGLFHRAIVQSGGLWMSSRVEGESLADAVPPGDANSSNEVLLRLLQKDGTAADSAAAEKRLAAMSPADVARYLRGKSNAELLGVLSVMLGASHGFEIPFVFGHFDLGQAGNIIFTEENDPGRQALSKAMMAYWAAFARSGSPGRGDGTLPEWTAWTGGSPQFIVLDTAAGGGLRMSGDTVTATGVLAALDADPRLGAPRDKCSALHSLAKWSRGFTEQEYAARAECKPFPFDTYPWDA